MSTDGMAVKNAIMLLLDRVAPFEIESPTEDKLLRSLLLRHWARLDGDDRGFDYWGCAANEYVKDVLEAEELPRY